MRERRLGMLLAMMALLGVSARADAETAVTLSGGKNDQLMHQIEDLITREDDPAVKAEMERVLQEMKAEMLPSELNAAVLAIEGSSPLAATDPKPAGSAKEQAMRDPRMIALQRLVASGQIRVEEAEPVGFQILKEYVTGQAASQP